MATSFWYDEIADYTATSRGWIDASNSQWIYEFKTRDYNGWDAPNNER